MLHALTDSTATISSDPASTTAMLASQSKRSLSQQTRYVLSNALHGLAHLKGLFETKTMTFTVIFLWLAYAADYWSFTLASGFLPLILQRRGAEQNQSLRDTYRSYIAIYTPVGSYYLEGFCKVIYLANHPSRVSEVAYSLQPQWKYQS